jgi:hypothetical protein
MGDRPGRGRVRQSLELKDDGGAQAGRRGAGTLEPGRGAQFRLRDGGVNGLGNAVLKELSGAYTEFARRLGGSPGSRSSS